MEPRRLSQAGMEIACRRFNQRVNAETDQRGPSFNVLLRSRFERCDFESKTLLLSFPVEEYMRNPSGVMHGGAVAGAMDLTMGSMAVYMAEDRTTPTITLNVSYERPIPTGVRLYVEAQCMSSGRTMAYVVSKAWLDDRPDRIVASASGTYYTAAP